MFDDPEWPFSDTVYVMTTATPDEVASWFDEHLRPDEDWAGFVSSVTYEPYAIPSGFWPFGAGWD